MHILIVKTSSLGDIVQCFPVVDYLRSKFPDAVIDWVVESPFAELLEAHPDVSAVLKISSQQWRRGKNWRGIPAFYRELRKKKYDVVFDLQGNTKSGLVTSLAKSPCKVGFGRQSISESANLLFTHRHYDPKKGLNVRYEYLYLVQSYFHDFTFPRDEGVCLHIDKERQGDIDVLLKQSTSSSRILVCPGSAWANKQISREALLEFLQLLQSHLSCCYLLAWGNKAEKEWVEEIKMHMPGHCTVIDKLSLPVLQYLMGRVDLIVAMDSLPLHLAATTSTPTFSVFGASGAQKYQPIGNRHFALQGNCPYGQTFERRCPLLRTCATGLCIKKISGQDLYQAFISSHLSINPRSIP